MISICLNPRRCVPIACFLLALAFLPAGGWGQGLLWKFSATNDSQWALPLTCPAVGADGTIFYPFNKTLYALSRSGGPMWSAELNGFALTPVIGIDGTIYVYSVEGTPNNGPLTNVLNAFAPTGSLKFRKVDFYNVPLAARGVSIARDGALLIGSGASSYNNAGVSCRSRADLNQWQYLYDESTGCGSNPFVVIGKDDTVYFGQDSASRCSGQQFFAVSGAGALKWKYIINFDCAQPSVGPDGSIYVGSRYGFNSFLRISPQGNVSGSLHSTNPATSFDASAIVDLSNDYYVGGSDGIFYGRKQDNPWQFSAGAPIQASAALGGDGCIYMGGGTNIFCLSTNGTEVWHLPLTNSLATSGLKLMAGGLLLVGTDAGLYGVQVSTGPARGGWPMVGHDLRNSGRASDYSGGMAALDHVGIGQGGFELSLNTELNVSYPISSSTNLSQGWEQITNVESANGLIYVPDPFLHTSQRFFSYPQY